MVAEITEGCTVVISGGALLVQGGAWPPQSFKFFLYHIYFNFFIL